MLAVLLLMNHNGLNNLGRGAPNEQFCQIILKLVQWFLTKRFLKFLSSFGWHGNQNPA